jgi:hypothetical protein
VTDGVREVGEVGESAGFGAGGGGSGPAAGSDVQALRRRAATSVTTHLIGPR